MADTRAIATAEPWLTALAGEPRPPRSKDREAIGELDTDYAISRAVAYLSGDAPEAQEGDAGDFTTYCIAARAIEDRQSVVSGRRVSVRVDHGGRRIIKKKTIHITHSIHIIMSQ